MRFSASCCILSKFYIKPQPLAIIPFLHLGCILSKFYIKPQPSWPPPLSRYCCILSKFYIKPQRVPAGAVYPGVVSYRNSTSNHNTAKTESNVGQVVSYRNSTSNHNADLAQRQDPRLYLIEILHQTTTSRSAVSSLIRCILSKFYIKPQRKRCW